MDTDVLRYFQQVSDGVTVTEIAELYQVSQPGVSRGLQRLEEEVGTPLLQRAGRVLRPTYAGTVFKRHVDALLHALDDGLAATEELADPETGTVRVAFQASLGTWLVPEVIAAFRQDHPRVRFRLKHSDDALGSSLVATGRSELEITGRRPRNPEVHWERLFRQPLHLAVPSSHPLAGRSPVDLAHAAEEDFVMFRPTWELRSLADELCARAGFSPRVAFEEDDLAVILGFVAAGLGAAVVPADRSWAAASSASPRAADVRQDSDAAVSAAGVSPIALTDRGAFREVGLAWSRDRPLLPSADLFRRHVLDTARGPLAGPTG